MKQSMFSIISPIDKPDEAPLLIEAGASELYGGYLPPEWERRFGLIGSINQRTFKGAQLDSEADLAKVTAQIHDSGGTFSLTLNSPFYSQEQFGLLVDYVGSAIRSGIDGVILADFSLLSILKEKFPDIEYHASTLAHLENSQAIQFAIESGIDRIILPRHQSLEEMATIVAAVPGVSFDAFMLIGKCPNTEGLCTFHHVNGKKIWPCELPYTIMPIDPSGSIEVMEQPEMAADETSVISMAMEKQASWSSTNRRDGCGVCALPALASAGINGVKLVGRGAPAAAKVQNIRFVNSAIELASYLVDNGGVLDDFFMEMRGAHKRRFGSSCHPNVCYYPELLR